MATVNNTNNRSGTGPFPPYAGTDDPATEVGGLLGLVRGQPDCVPGHINAGVSGLTRSLTRSIRRPSDS